MKRWTDEDLDMLVKLNGEGKNYAEISRLIDKPYKSCQQRGRDMGLKVPSNVNENFFKEDSEDMYYVFGYWFADGCIMKKSGGHYFSIVSIDKEHLENIRKVMKITNPVCDNSNDAFEIRFGNKKLVESIIELGGDYRKRGKTKLSDLKIPDEYFMIFLRGFFDGDGHIRLSGFEKTDGSRSISTITITGWSELMEEFKCRVGGKTHVDERHKDCSQLHLHGDAMRNLLHSMYKDSNIHLQRKYDVYNKALN